MDVFGEIEVELLELEAEQGFIGDGMGADAGYLLETQIGPVMTEQGFDEFSDFAAYDIPQDSVGTLGNSALTGALAEWLDAFVSVDDATIIDDDAPSLDEKTDLVLMTEGDGTPPDPNNPTFWDDLYEDIYNVVDLNNDGEIYGEAEVAAFVAAGILGIFAGLASGWAAAALAVGSAASLIIGGLIHLFGGNSDSGNDSNESENSGDGEDE